MIRMSFSFEPCNSAKYNFVINQNRIVVAPLGSSYLDKEGFEVTVEKASIGGVLSGGMFCDSKMLGWTSGGRGIAAILPYTFEIGSVPPPSKPRPPKDSESDEDAPPPEPQGLFEKKLSKEEKKKLAEERRRARKAAKAAKNRSDNGPEVNDSGDVHDHDDS